MTESAFITIPASLLSVIEARFTSSLVVKLPFHKARFQGTFFWSRPKKMLEAASSMAEATKELVQTADPHRLQVKKASDGCGVIFFWIPRPVLKHIFCWSVWIHKQWKCLIKYESCSPNSGKTITALLTNRNWLPKLEFPGIEKSRYWDDPTICKGHPSRCALVRDLIQNRWKDMAVASTK